MRVVGALLLALALAWGAYERHQHLGWRDYAHRLEAAAAANAAATNSLRTREAQAYRKEAANADARHAADVDRVRAATDAFVVSRRVRTDGSCRPAQPIGEAADPGEPQDLPTGIIVDEADVRAAAQWNAYGVACHDYLQAIGPDG